MNYLKKTLDKIRIFILKIITYFAALSVLIGACAADSENISIPIIMIVFGVLWLVLIAYVNDWSY